MGNKFTKEASIQKQYKIGAVLGTGSFATVKKGIRKADGKEFAVKIIKKNKLNTEELAVVKDEVVIMKRVKHESCVKLIEMFESKSKVYMVLELLSGGELFDRIVSQGSYSEKQAAELIKKIASAIQYLHSVGVVHRDLKPENLIYADSKADSTIKITDFGLAKYNNESSSMATACGTPGYVAPEVLKSQAYGPPVDLWSMGVILYILLCGFPPFYHDCTIALYKQIRKGEYEFPDPYWSDISENAKDLVRGLLTVDPAQRLTPAQVLDHQWVSGGKASATPFAKDQMQRMQLLLLKRKLRRGVKAVIFFVKFKRVVLESLVDEQK